MTKQKYALHIITKKKGIMELPLAWPFNMKRNFTLMLIIKTWKYGPKDAKQYIHKEG